MTVIKNNYVNFFSDLQVRAPGPLSEWLDNNW